jgi:uncharacterized 2Fe-2S/4Fe-4S cluster protein (DUF4445 family)
MSPKGPFADRSYELTVVPEAGITFSRADASALAQAKAANTVGQWALLRRLGVDPGEVDRLYLAGGFATYVDVRNAVEIGFLAPVPQERVVKAGNAALRGARELLLSTRYGSSGGPRSQDRACRARAGPGLLRAVRRRLPARPDPDQAEARR